MNDWSDIARRSAAHEFGRRHYRWYALTRHSGSIGVAAAIIVAALVVLVGGWWITRQELAPVILLAIAGATVIVGAFRLAWLLSPFRVGLVYGSGGLGWLLLLVVVCVVGAAVLS